MPASRNFKVRFFFFRESLSAYKSGLERAAVRATTETRSERIRATEKAIGKREANGVPLPLYSRARQDKTRQEMAFAMRHSSRVTLRKVSHLARPRPAPRPVPPVPVLTSNLSPAISLGYLCSQAPKLSVSSRGARGASRSVTVSAATTETLSKVQGIIAEQLGTDVEKIGSDAKFVDLGADSLDTVEIMMALEEEFDITLDEEGAENIATVQQAADMIEDMK